MKRVEIYDRYRFVFLLESYKRICKLIDVHLSAPAPEHLMESHQIMFSVLMDERSKLHKRIFKAIPKDYKSSQWYFAKYDEIIIQKVSTL